MSRSGDFHGDDDRQTDSQTNRLLYPCACARGNNYCYAHGIALKLRDSSYINSVPLLPFGYMSIKLILRTCDRENGSQIVPVAICMHVQINIASDVLN